MDWFHRCTRKNSSIKCVPKRKRRRRKKTQSSLVDPELEESIQKQKEEFANYQDKLLEVKKRDEQLLRDVEEAMNQEQELKDKIDQEMHEHMHGNDESSAIIENKAFKTVTRKR